MYRWALLTAVLSAVSCAGGERAFESPSTIVGKVVMIGNDPFASPALQMPDGTIYPLVMEEDTLRKVCAVQGRWVRIHVDRADQGPWGVQMRVQRVEVLEQPSSREKP
jgi:hypothetical protein